jgi:hypothetical protein
MQQRPNTQFRIRVLATNAAHVPRTALARETVFALTPSPSPIRWARESGAARFHGPVFVHRIFLPRIDTDAHGCFVICVFIGGASFPLLS